MHRVLTAAALVLLTALPAVAKPVIYNCAVDSSRVNNWIGKQIVIAYDADTGAVEVNDPIISHYIGKPVPGKVGTENDKRITFIWTLKDITNDSGQNAPTFNYRATYIKATGRLSVSAKPLNYDNHFTAQGNCKIG